MTVAVLSALAVVLVAVVLFLGLVGVNTTVRAGTQASVCGTTFGVSTSAQTVRLLGVSDEPYGPGDRVRLNPFCVATVVSIDDSESDPEQDGGAADVHLTWRLW